MTKYFGIGTILIGVLLTSFAHAQQIKNGSLTGKIVENSTKTPIQGANILLFKTKDGSQVSGTTTNENGIFNFPNLPNSSYYLQVGFIGFEILKTRSFTIKDEKLDLGTLTITVSPIVMGNVEVTAEKETFINSIDRKVYNVEKDILSQTGSASDLLQNIPSVSIDVDGNISLRGAPNVTIFVNGKPSLLMRKNSAAALQQMPANTIERIEVITNPSAKYKLDGVGGIINLVLKKESRQGLNGTVLANAGNLGRYNANATINYNPGKVNLFGSYGFRYNNSPRSSIDSRIQKDSLSQVFSYYDNTSSASSKPFAHIANVGLDYSINDKNKVGISGDYFYQDSYLDQNSQTTFRDGNRHITSDFTTNRTRDEIEKEYEINSNYEHDFDKEDHVLSFELNYSGYDENEDNYYDEIYTVPNISDVLHHILVQKGGHLTEFYAEYAYPIDEGTELEAGYVGEFMRDDIRNLGEDFDPQSSRWITDFNKTNRFLFHQDIHALYATFGHSIEDFSFLAGLRAEQALITSNLVSADSTIPNNYFKLYPTLHLAYDVNDNHEFQINYSRRVRRADSDEHNPFAEYSDPRNMEAGNPKIKPEQINSIEFGYHLKQKHFSVLPTIYYRYKYDAFTEIRQFVNDTTMLTTFANIANDQSAGMEFIVAGDVKKIMSLNLSADAFYQVIDASNLGYSDKKSTISWNAKLAANLHFTSSNLIQVNAYYRSARLTPQGKRLPSFLLNLGMRQDLFNQKASLTLTVSDVFKSLKWKRQINTPILFEETISKRNSQIIYLGFTYRFGKSAKKENQKEEFEFEDAIK
ncbi:TonB-dependent receptor [candidate division KSB1 bacterium]|nr:TonB-dependent receptor [candidate division KSB1 bacterium]